MQDYVLTWQGGAPADEATGRKFTQIELTGPFPSQGNAAAWGRKWQADNADDPRWQCVTLDPDNADGFIAVPVRAPS